MHTQIAQAKSYRTQGLIAGSALILVGLVAFGLERSGMNADDWLFGSGWTLLIILPGLALFAAALLVDAEKAQGLTTAGSVVTTVGLLLLYQDRTGHYESWAYAWTLIPMSVGASLLVHGARVHRRDLVTVGMRMIAALGALLAVGAWYFETVFRSGRAPVDLGGAWPLVLVGFGAVILIAALLRTEPKQDLN